VYDHLEIWDRSAWQTQMKEIEENAEDAAERVSAKRD
jgi:DNA-binding transcriptional regulator/RsmH inhibitor MraZ